MKKLVAVAAVLAVLFVAGYLLWTTMTQPPVTSTPAAVAASLPTAAAGPTAPPVTVTIVAVSLNKDGVPTQIGPLPLTTTTQGKDTLNAYAAMYGDGFDLVNGYRADYASGNSKATLWVGQAKDAATATKLADGMASKIGQGGNGMFANLSPLTISGRTLYQTTGLGQQLYFFYAINDKLVWLAVDPANATDGLHSIWSVLK
ncbi:MAG: hypothetical protein WCF84_13925 [Anaerolineae bacterium]